MKYKFISVIIFLFVMCYRLNAQPYYFRHYKGENGLITNRILCSTQDDKGFMWFGTDEGVYRFDGHTFKAFKSKGDHAINGYINCLYQDRTGIIWAGTAKGLYHYNAINESFHLLKGTQAGNINEIKMDKEGNLWFVSELNLIKYSTKTGKFHSYNRLNESFTSICTVADGSIWVSTLAGLIKKYNPVSDSFNSYDMFKQSKAPHSKWIQKIYDAGNGYLLIGTHTNGAKLFDTKTSSYKDILAKNADGSGIFVRDFLRNTEDEYWIATETGIYIYNRKSGKSVNLRKNYNDPYSLSHNSIPTLCKDKEGGIWVGTSFGGINYYHKGPGSFKKYFLRAGINSISGNIVRVIHPGNNGQLWIGTEDAGLNKLDAKTGLFTHYMPGSSPQAISHYNVQALLLHGNELWISTLNHGLDVMDVNTGKVIRHYSMISDFTPIDFVPFLLKTRSGKIMAATLGGVYEYNSKLDKFQLYKQLPTNYFYNNLFEDKSGTIWAGAFNYGLKYFNPNTRQTGNYKLDPKTSDSRNNWVNWIFEDKHSTLWIATQAGLSKFNRKTGKIKQYTTANGFPGSTIYTILEDNKQNLWMSTSKGLVCFSPATEKLQVYTKANGLLCDQFNYNSAYKDPNGRMYFGSADGMISFHPDELKGSSFNPPLYITGFQVNNQELDNSENSLLEKSISQTEKVTLPHDKSSFSIDFASLSYVVPELTEYAYQMKGLEKEWTYLKTNRKVYFTGLAPGSYTFYVKAKNGAGSWGQTKALAIKILPPYWASVWAYILYTIALFTGAYYIIRHYSKHNQLEKEKAIHQAKIEFFTNVAHEIRTPLTLIKGPMDVILKSVEEMPNIKENLHIMERNTDLLLSLTNQLLDFRKMESEGFKLYFVKTDIAEIIKNIHLRYKGMAQQKGLDLQITVPAVPYYAYADIDALNKIVSNLLDNALKYAETRVEIVLVPETGIHFTILMKNDGYLIPEELKEKIFEPFYRLKETSQHSGSGIGLSFARSLAELHHGKLELKEPEQGINVFELTLPVHQHVEPGVKINILSTPATDESFRTTEHRGDSETDGPAILVVDDNLEILRFISVNISKEYKVIVATNGYEALDILANRAVQLVISDLMMPEMDGLELCQRIKSNIEYSHVPVILLTAKNSLQAKIEGLSTGADAYLEKPFSLQYVEAQIASLLENRKKLRDHFASSPQAPISTLAHSKAEEEFLEKLNTVIYENLSNKDLDIDLLADLFSMSRRTFYRKIEAISNLSPVELINIARLKRTSELLLETDYKLNAISAMVGYSSDVILRKNFIKQFGMSPSEYVNSKQPDRKI